MKEPQAAIALEGPSKLLTLKRKVGYDEVNSEPEKQFAGNRSIEVEAAGGEGFPGKCYAPNMEVD